jgi:hypothetical protein
MECKSRTLHLQRQGCLSIGHDGEKGLKQSIQEFIHAKVLPCGFIFGQMFRDLLLSMFARRDIRRDADEPWGRSASVACR